MNETKNKFIHPKALVESDSIGNDTRIWAFVHILKGAVIGNNCNIGDHCFIEGNVKIGNNVVIKNNVTLWEGVYIEDDVFIGPNASFTNDLLPRAKVYRDDYDKTIVKKGASVGANATLISPLTIGKYALIGGGAVVTQDIPDFGLVYGNPARLRGFVCRCGKTLPIKLNQDGEVSCSCGLIYSKNGIHLTEISKNK